ncbi:MAG TPA: alpha/beta fold hydrolase [Trebonia sp.]
MLFLHAAGGAGTWSEFHALLARRFEIIAPDHPGFGKSDEFPDAEGVDDLVYHYLDVLDALELGPAHVVGASFGGWIAAICWRRASIWPCPRKATKRPAASASSPPLRGN